VEKAAWSVLHTNRAVKTVRILCAQAQACWPLVSLQRRQQTSGHTGRERLGHKKHVAEAAHQGKIRSKTSTIMTPSVMSITRA